MSVLYVLLFTAPVLVLSGIVLWLAVQVDRLKSEIIENEFADHARCMSHVAAYVGDTFAAKVLDAAADAYDSAEEHGNLIRLRRAFDPEGSTSIPAMWMHDRAASMQWVDADV